MNKWVDGKPLCTDCKIRVGVSLVIRRKVYCSKCSVSHSKKNLTAFEDRTTRTITTDKGTITISV